VEGEEEEFPPVGVVHDAGAKASCPHEVVGKGGERLTVLPDGVGAGADDEQVVPALRRLPGSNEPVDSGEVVSKHRPTAGVGLAKGAVKLLQVPVQVDGTGHGEDLPLWRPFKAAWTACTMVRFSLSLFRASDMGMIAIPPMAAPSVHMRHPSRRSWMGIQSCAAGGAGDIEALAATGEGFESRLRLLDTMRVHPCYLSAIRFKVLLFS
jgi:hypothetical protein